MEGIKGMSEQQQEQAGAAPAAEPYIRSNSQTVLLEAAMHRLSNNQQSSPSPGSRSVGGFYSSFVGPSRRRLSFSLGRSSDDAAPVVRKQDTDADDYLSSPKPKRVTPWDASESASHCSSTEKDSLCNDASNSSSDSTKKFLVENEELGQDAKMNKSDQKSAYWNGIFSSPTSIADPSIARVLPRNQSTSMLSESPHCHAESSSFHTRGSDMLSPVVPLVRKHSIWNSVAGSLSNPFEASSNKVTLEERIGEIEKPVVTPVVRTSDAYTFYGDDDDDDGMAQTPVTSSHLRDHSMIGSEKSKNSIGEDDNEPPSQHILVVIAKEGGTVRQIAQSQKAIRLMKTTGASIDVIDGTSREQRFFRQELFDLSEMPNTYPQIFEFDDGTYTFLGTLEKLERLLQSNPFDTAEAVSAGYSSCDDADEDSSCDGGDGDQTFLSLPASWKSFQSKEVSHMTNLDTQFAKLQRQTAEAESDEDSSYDSENPSQPSFHSVGESQVTNLDSHLEKCQTIEAESGEEASSGRADEYSAGDSVGDDSSCDDDEEEDKTFLSLPASWRSFQSDEASGVNNLGSLLAKLDSELSSPDLDVDLTVETQSYTEEQSSPKLIVDTDDKPQNPNFDVDVADETQRSHAEPSSPNLDDDDNDEIHQNEDQSSPNFFVETAYETQSDEDLSSQNLIVDTSDAELSNPNLDVVTDKTHSDAVLSSQNLVVDPHDKTQLEAELPNPTLAVNDVDESPIGVFSLLAPDSTETKSASQLSSNSKKDKKSTKRKEVPLPPKKKSKDGKESTSRKCSTLKSPKSPSKKSIGNISEGEERVRSKSLTPLINSKKKQKKKSDKKKKKKQAIDKGVESQYPSDTKKKAKKTKDGQKPGKSPRSKSLTGSKPARKTQTATTPKRGRSTSVKPGTNGDQKQKKKADSPDLVLKGEKDNGKPGKTSISRRLTSPKSSRKKSIDASAEGKVRGRSKGVKPRVKIVDKKKTPVKIQSSPSDNPNLVLARKKNKDGRKLGKSPRSKSVTSPKQLKKKLTDTPEGKVRSRSKGVKLRIKGEHKKTTAGHLLGSQISPSDDRDSIRARKKSLETSRRSKKIASVPRPTSSSTKSTDKTVSEEKVGSKSKSVTLRVKSDKKKKKKKEKLTDAVRLLKSDAVLLTRDVLSWSKKRNVDRATKPTAKHGGLKKKTQQPKD